MSASRRPRPRRRLAPVNNPFASDGCATAFSRHGAPLFRHPTQCANWAAQNEGDARRRREQLEKSRENEEESEDKQRREKKLERIQARMNTLQYAILDLTQDRDGCDINLYPICGKQCCLPEKNIDHATAQPAVPWVGTVSRPQFFRHPIHPLHLNTNSTSTANRAADTAPSTPESPPHTPPQNEAFYSPALDLAPSTSVGATTIVPLSLTKSIMHPSAHYQAYIPFSPILYPKHPKRRSVRVRRSTTNITSNSTKLPLHLQLTTSPTTPINLPAVKALQLPPPAIDDDVRAKLVALLHSESAQPAFNIGTNATSADKVSLSSPGNATRLVSSHGSSNQQETDAGDTSADSGRTFVFMLLLLLLATLALLSMRY